MARLQLEVVNAHTGWLLILYILLKSVYHCKVNSILALLQRLAWPPFKMVQSTPKWSIEKDIPIKS
jgi:hypothetical protein